MTNGMSTVAVTGAREFERESERRQALQAAGQGIRIGANAAIVRDGKLLLVEFDAAADLHYNLPGGGLDPGETLHDGVRREVLEETSADVDVGRLLLVVEYVPRLHGYLYGRTHKLGFVFECHLRPGSEPRLPDVLDPKQTGLRWVPLDELPHVPLLPTTPFAQHLVAALRQREPLDVLHAPHLLGDTLGVQRYGDGREIPNHHLSVESD